MERKPPRRTRERILELSLRLFNEFGEPNITTTVIADEMNISPGNLYYHFRNKDDIINSIFSQFEKEIDALMTVPTDRTPNVEDVWLFLNVVFELIWKYRFFYRDLNDLLSKNRTLEVHFKRIIARWVEIAGILCAGMAEAGEMNATPREIEALSTNIVVVATYWLSYEYVRNARQFNEPQAMSQAMSRGVYQVMALAAPFLIGDSRELFQRLAAEYLEDGS